jgi:hypothetical protein
MIFEVNWNTQQSIVALLVVGVDTATSSLFVVCIARGGNIAQVVTLSECDIPIGGAEQNPFPSP